MKYFIIFQLASVADLAAENEYFLGFEDFVDIFWVITKLDYIFRGHFYAF